MNESKKTTSVGDEFAIASQSLVINPKSTSKTQAFVYHGMQDLENLIAFVGVSPKVSVEKGKIVLAFKKQIILDNRVILRNSYGEVIAVMTYGEASEKYEIIAQSPFLPEHKNKLEEKIKYVRKENRK